MLAFAMMAAIRRHANSMTPQKNKTQDLQRFPPPLIRWSVQEIRRIATRLAQRRIQPAQIIAWSIWRRAHQASAKQTDIRARMQL